jgi:hypothetical protein
LLRQPGDHLLNALIRRWRLMKLASSRGES